MSYKADLGERICDYVRTGNITMLRTLYECGFLDPRDTFDTTGRKHHQSYDAITLLNFVAIYRCPNYKEMIDLMIEYGGNIQDTRLPLEEALMNGNYDIAAYIHYKGGQCNWDEVINYAKQIEVDIIKELEDERKKLDYANALYA